METRELIFGLYLLIMNIALIAYLYTGYKMRIIGKLSAIVVGALTETMFFLLVSDIFFN